MVSFVEDKKTDLIKANESMQETLIEDLCCTHKDHVIAQMLIPYTLVPQICTHFATESIDLLIKIAFQNSILLKDQGYTVNLVAHQQRRSSFPDKIPPERMQSDEVSQ